MQLFQKASGHYLSKSVSNQPRPPVKHPVHWKNLRITFYITSAVGLFELLLFLLHEQLALNLFFYVQNHTKNYLKAETMC